MASFFFLYTLNNLPFRLCCENIVLMVLFILSSLIFHQLKHIIFTIICTDLHILNRAKFMSMFKMWKVDVYPKRKKNCARELLFFYCLSLTTYHINSYEITLSLNIFFSLRNMQKCFHARVPMGRPHFFEGDYLLRSNLW